MQRPCHNAKVHEAALSCINCITGMSMNCLNLFGRKDLRQKCRPRKSAVMHMQAAEPGATRRAAAAVAETDSAAKSSRTRVPATGYWPLAPDPEP